MVDVIVVGLGAIGSSVAYHLAERGIRVVGLEQFTAAHDKGSSHGSSRVIRQAYFEHPAYVPLVLRSYELWERLQVDTRSNLLHVTGGLMIGTPSSAVIQGSLRSARQHNLSYEIFEAAELRRRFPPLTPTSDEVGLYEQKAGYVLPEESIRQSLKRATHFGADLHFEEPVEAWTVGDSNGRVQVKTAKATYEAERLIICSGAWTPEVCSTLGLPLVVTRQVMFWFNPVGGISPFLPDHFPVYMWQPEDSRLFYGFPSIDGKNGGVKVAVHGSDDVCTPAKINRAVSTLEVLAIERLLAPRIPQLAGKLISAKTCMYTMTPDENFIIGISPQHPSVLVAAGFSGHGFKFSMVIGEILADLAIHGTTRHNIELFSTQRFKNLKVADSNQN